MSITKKIPVPPKGEEHDKQWDNPAEPENAADERDEEQLARQKKEAELRKSNLTEDNEDQ